MRNRGDGLDAWVSRQVRRELRRACIVGLIWAASLAWGIYGR